ncbi:hypothetical protein ACQ86N_08035 [Puia sp. P3]|uniref:hypothetical protein n=1 Tax=Puia sp. P3 TaxID=3423952 RepID=UPI003D663C84
MHLLLFIGYSLLIIYGLLKIPFVRDCGIRPVFVLLFFALHAATGILHNWIAFRYYPGHGDPWQFYQLSFMYRTRLLSDFSRFMEDNSTLTYITHNGIIGVNMLLNIFSRDNLDINTLLFSFPVFLGNIALFRVFRRRFPDAAAAALTVFLLPSTLFWTVCIHREGVLYMLLGLLTWAFDRWLVSPRLHRRSLYCCLLSLLLILFFRFYIVLSLLPALVIWLLLEKPSLTRRLLTPVAAIAALTILLLVFAPGLSGRLAQAITARQLEFSQLEGNSRLPLPRWTAPGPAFLGSSPQPSAMASSNHLPGSGGKPLYLAFSVELVTIWCLIIISLLWRRKHPSAPQPFLAFCLFFSLSGLLVIGAMVPFAGAIVRYRSFFLPFLLAPALWWLKTFPIIRRLDDLVENHILNSNHSY